MLIKILGLKISLEIIILLLVIYLVMMVHALAGCCNAGAISEGLRTVAKMPKLNRPKINIKKNPTYSIKNGKLVENIIL
jgi:hypothetical protein